MSTSYRWSCRNTTCREASETTCIEHYHSFTPTNCLTCGGWGVVVDYGCAPARGGNPATRPCPNGCPGPPLVMFPWPPVDQRDSELATLRAEVARLTRERDEWRVKWRSADAERHAARDDESDANARIALLEDKLRLVLPLAKGYAAEHPVGSNAIYVEEADAALRGDEAKEVGR